MTSESKEVGDCSVVCLHWSNNFFKIKTEKQHSSSITCELFRIRWVINTSVVISFSWKAPSGFQKNGERWEMLWDNNNLLIPSPQPILHEFSHFSLLCSRVPCAGNTAENDHAEGRYQASKSETREKLLQRVEVFKGLEVYNKRSSNFTFWGNRYMNHWEKTLTL